MGTSLTRLRASVCIPTRNRVDLLRLTLQNLNWQSAGLDRWQVVVGVDGSDDGTIDMLREFRAPYELTWTRLDGRGSGAARNAAARHADGDVLIFLDDDQLSSPDLVTAHLEAHERYGTVIVQGDSLLAAGWDVKGASLTNEWSRRSCLGSGTLGAAVSHHLWGANFSVRRQTWAQLGGFDESLLRNQDLDFGLSAAELGVPIVLELEARSYHLHRVSVAGYRSQCLTQGRCTVRISRKHRVPVETLLGTPVDRPLDRVLKVLWVRRPRVAAGAGRCLSGLLLVADLLRVRPAQIFWSRAVKRFYELGGIALESARPAVLESAVDRVVA